MLELPGLDLPYLNGVLSTSSALPITHFTVQPVQGGQSGALFYSILAHNPPPQPPIRLLLKLDGGVNEIHFYQDLASRIPIQTPQVIDTRVDPPHHAWLLMEEVAGVRDNLCWTADDYRLVIQDMARLHAAYWGKTSTLEGCAWLRKPYAQGAEKEVRKLQTECAALRSSWLPHALPSLFRLERLEAFEVVLSQPQRMIDPLAAAGLTFVHGDYWFHNLLLTTRGERFLIDWQACHIGSGLWELVYFIDLLHAIRPGEYRIDLPVAAVTLETEYQQALLEYGVQLSEADFQAGMRGARLWHPLWHWLHAYGQVAVRGGAPFDEDESTVAFLTGVFDRWQETAQELYLL